MARLVPSCWHDLRASMRWEGACIAGLSGQRVLLLDDAADLERYLIRHLEDAGAEVVVARSGKEALDLLQVFTITGAIVGQHLHDRDAQLAVRRLHSLGVAIVVRDADTAEESDTTVPALARRVANRR
jgi:CheY-like chemotaxis protein